MFKIYHANKDIHRDAVFYELSSGLFDLQRAQLEFGDGNYELVAEMPADSAEQAFCKSQNICSDWLMGQDVADFVESARSTSVGDIIVTDTDEAYVVGSFGFDLVDIAAVTA